MQDTIKVKEISVDEFDVMLVGTAPLVTRALAWAEGGGRPHADTTCNRVIDNAYWIYGKPEYGTDEESSRKSLMDAVGGSAAIGFPDVGIRYAMGTAESFSRGLKSHRPSIPFRASVFVDLHSKGGLAPISFDGFDVCDCKVKRGRRELEEHCPMFVGWSVRAKVTVVDNGNFSKDEVVDLLRKAGTDVGLGYMRPEKGGEFGTFDVVLE